jgi:hypothetical protein
MVVEQVKVKLNFLKELGWSQERHLKDHYSEVAE